MAKIVAHQAVPKTANQEQEIASSGPGGLCFFLPRTRWPAAANPSRNMGAIFVAVAIVEGHSPEKVSGTCYNPLLVANRFGPPFKTALASGHSESQLSNRS